MALLFGTACAGVVVPLSMAVDAPVITAPTAAPERSSLAAQTAEDRELEAALAGLWTRWEARAEGQKIRFWYFHGDGKGLYRYGRVGHTNTHSFDYGVVDGRLRLVFRKTAASHDVDVRIDEDAAGRPRLRLDPDPEEAGARYVRVEAPISDATARAELARRAPGGRLWIDYQRYATGGTGFEMYQFNAPAIDGRGIGWFHRGDFDDWSTESLTYRIDGDRMELYFDLGEELASSTFEIREQGEHRYLELRDDPRDFYKDHTYVDAGASFGRRTWTHAAVLSDAWAR